MKPPTPKVLLDTNIWVDYYTGREPGFSDSVRLIRSMVEKGIPLYATSLSTKDVFFLVSAQLKRYYLAEETKTLNKAQALAIKEASWKCVEHMVGLAELIGITAAECRRALRLRAVHDDYEDGMILAAIESEALDVLITNDRALLKKAPIKAYTPHEYEEELQKMGI